VIVLDASAVVDMIADRPHKGWVAEQLRGTRILAPAHQPVEVLSAVARLVRAEVLTPTTARDALAEAGALQQDIVVPLTRHQQRAFDLRERVRVTDGLYVALAEDHGATLITTDERLASADLPVDVRTPASR
jgi:predicted nucleic acid-binding protein